MRAVCAWCQQEGRETVLGEREPADDRATTHGICAQHAQKLLECLPSRSFPGIRLLIVVRRTETSVYEHLTRIFTGIDTVAVILDRREGERRQISAGVTVDRRRGNRRVRKAEFSALGYLIVRFGPEHATASAPESVKTSSTSGQPADGN